MHALPRDLRGLTARPGTLTRHTCRHGGRLLFLIHLLAQLLILCREATGLLGPRVIGWTLPEAQER